MKINFKRKKEKLSKSKLASIIVAFLAIFISLTFLIITIFLVNVLKDTPSFNLNKFKNIESSKIYDRNNELIADIGQTIRENIDYSQFPTSLIDAFVATEDSRFFVHNGFDMSRFTKAVISNVISIFSKSKKGFSGASTFTMQLVKNSYFTDDEAGILAASKGKEGIKRKFQEISLALELEKHINKKTILELYINKINFGANGRGIENAANYYFGKNTKELNLSESALLVGVINSPYYYNPFNYLDNSTQRRDIVINLMQRHGYISEQEAKLAKSIKVEDLLVGSVSQNKKLKGIPYQAYIDTVIKEAENMIGLSPYNTTMEIYTHLDKKTQQLMDNIQEENTDGYVEFADDRQEIASIAVENTTGGIVGVLGGRNYAKGGSLLLNHATEQFKQPGSSIKTILEFPLAFEKLGWSTSHVVLDYPMFYRGTDILINNFDNQFRGEVKLIDAVAHSYNIPAITALEQVIEKTSTQDVVNYMNDIGFHQVNRDNFNIQFAIGGAELEVSALQLAGAQAAILNGGTYHKPHTIRKIKFSNGREDLNPIHTGKRVLTPAAAFQTTELLRNNLKIGHSYAYNGLGRGIDTELYVKSGTTDWGSEGKKYDIPYGANKDAWILASNADYTVATWVGYEHAIKGKDTWMSYAKMAKNPFGRATNLILRKLHEVNGTKNEIKKPDDTTNITHILGTYPYAQVIDGMDPNLITSGYIAKKYANLVPIETHQVENLKTFNAKIDKDGTSTFEWAAYPKPEALILAPSDIDISLRDSSGNIIKEVYGKRLFDYSWLFGPIKYKAKVYVNNQEVKTIISNSEKLQEKIEIYPGNKMKVCGYYGYEKKEINSNVLCQEFIIENNTISIKYPEINSSDSLESIKNTFTTFASKNNLKLKFEIDNENATKYNVKIYLNNVEKIMGQVENYKLSELNNLELKVEIKERKEN